MRKQNNPIHMLSQARGPHEQRTLGRGGLDVVDMQVILHACFAKGGN